MVKCSECKRCEPVYEALQEEEEPVSVRKKPGPVPKPKIVAPAIEHYRCSFYEAHCDPESEWTYCPGAIVSVSAS